MEYQSDGVTCAERNVRTLLRSIVEMQEVAKPLFVQWPANAAPFAVVLVFANGKDRDRCRSYLEAEQRVLPDSLVAV